MGILDFLKKILKEEKKEEIQTSEVSFPKLEEFLNLKLEEIKEKEKSTLSIVIQRINTFTNELKEKINIVESVDIEQKEKNDKIKSLVYEGRKKYIIFLERLIDNLEEHKQIDNLEKLMENINSSFSRFNENSGKSYERATILIGKEMGNIRDALKKFSTDIIETYNESKETLAISKKIHLIQSKIKENEEIKNKLNEMEEDIENIENKIKLKEKEIKDTSEVLEKIRKSQEYLKNIEIQEKIFSQEEEIKKEIIELRQIIDFKALSNFFHIFEDKMEIIKSYKDNFLEEFKRDKASKILNLLNESKLNNEKINEKIKIIQHKEKDIEKNKKEVKKDETENISITIENKKEDLNNLTNEKSWKEKKKDSLKENQDKNAEKIKESLKSISIEIKS